MQFDLERVRARVLQDALQEGLRSYWHRRATAFEAAMHKPGDFAGLCSVEQIAEANERLAAKAKACRRHAEIVEFQDLDVLDELLEEAA